MKRSTYLIATLGLVVLMMFVFSNGAFAQDINNGQRHGIGFVDNNGDGFNDNAPDADGDGIPNGMDPDYTGSKMHKGHGMRGFVDADGDGINDNALDADGDGIPNSKDPDFVRPMDGSGRMNHFGKGKAGSLGQGSGTCDGSGSKGSEHRGGGRR